MCGIFGYISKKSEEHEKVLKYITKRMFLATQERGRDAVGYATIMPSNKVLYYKQPGTATQFITSGKYDEHIKLGKIFIGHCRAGTHGTPKNNVNNHPILSKELGGALVHNGVISNSNTVIKDLKLGMEGECDSEVIMRVMEKQNGNNFIKDIQKTCKELRGSCTFAFITKQAPDDLYLVRISNPLIMAYVPQLDTIFFASTEDILGYGLSKSEWYFHRFEKRRPVYEYLPRGIQDDTMVKIMLRNGKFDFTERSVEGKSVTYYRSGCSHEAQKELDLQNYGIDGDSGQIIMGGVEEQRNQWDEGKPLLPEDKVTAVPVVRNDIQVGDYWSKERRRWERLV